MVANLYAIEPNRCPELRFVDTENSHGTWGGDFERAAVPKPVAFLARHARVIDDGALGKFPVTHPIQYHLPAIELVYLGEGWLSRVRKPRYRRLVVPGGRNRLRLSRILDIPNPVQGDSRSLGPPQGEREGCSDRQNG